MINRVELREVYAYIVELEERKKKELSQREEKEGVKVEVSGVLSHKRSVDYEDLSRKVERIRQELERGTYEVSPEKVLKGIEKYLSSK